MEEVALLAEEVDRNDDVSVEDAAQMKVALLAEGVDRNLKVGHGAPGQRKVALLAEGVDRNRLNCHIRIVDTGRPPRGGRG